MREELCRASREGSRDHPSRRLFKRPRPQGGPPRVRPVSRRMARGLPRYFFRFASILSWMYFAPTLLPAVPTRTETLVSERVRYTTVIFTFSS